MAGLRHCTVRDDDGLRQHTYFNPAVRFPPFVSGKWRAFKASASFILVRLELKGGTVLPKLLLLIAVMALAACATPYQSGGLAGGYYQTQGPGQLLKVTFSGNGYIKSDAVQQYALYRSAEVAKEKKKPYFIIYETLLAASVGKPSELPTVGIVGNKPTAFAFVLFLDSPQPGAKDTDKTLAEIGEVIKQNEQKQQKTQPKSEEARRS